MGSLNKGFQDFHRLSFEERQARVAKWCELDDQELEILKGKNALPIETAEHLIENVIGVFPLPLGVATYLNIDGRERFIPMAVEETSIIAALSSTAKWIQQSQGSIKTESLGRLIIGQIQIPKVQNLERSIQLLKEATPDLLQEANEWVPGLVARGGGIRSFEFRSLDREDGMGKMLVVHVLCDPCDAMGANLINQVCEGLKPKIEEITQEKVGLCILSNLVDGKRVRAEVILRGIEASVAYGIQEASQFALSDPYRATTHNKGVLNGIDPVLIATGNDWRAVEAGIHAYASRTGKYQPITRWEVIEDDGSGHVVLKGEFDAPLAVGTVGGVTQLHPTARLCLKILGVHRAEELARICGAMGLVQNLGALRALATVGIVKGHMRLHAGNLALQAGASDDELPRLKKELSEVLAQEKKINLSRAKELLAQIRQSSKFA